jgi:hypothetical protein
VLGHLLPCSSPLASDPPASLLHLGQQCLRAPFRWAGSPLPSPTLVSRGCHPFESSTMRVCHCLHGSAFARSVMATCEACSLTRGPPPFVTSLTHLAPKHAHHSPSLWDSSTRAHNCLPSPRAATPLATQALSGQLDREFRLRLRVASLHDGQLESSDYVLPLCRMTSLRVQTTCCLSA